MRREAGPFPHAAAAGRASARLAGLAFFLALSSVAPVQKYLGSLGVVAYTAIVFAVVLWGLRPLSRWLTARVTERQALWLASLTLVLLGLAFALVYPIADAGVVGGGSDRDDNLTDATLVLLAGRYPYYVRSYLGLPPDILPGTMILAAPFVLLGDSAYQNFLWLAVYAAVARWLLRDGRQALLLLWSALAFAPTVLIELVTGGELISNTIYVLVFGLLLARAAARQPRLGRWQAAACAVLFGVALASRISFILLVPLIFSALVQHAGWQRAIVFTAIALGAFAAVTLPFYLYDPAGFAPAHYQNRFDLYRAVLPNADYIIPGVTALLAVGLALRPVDRAGFLLLSNCALVQVFPIVSGHLLTTLQTRGLAFSFGVEGWGLFFLFFGVLGAWPTIAGSGPRR